MLQNVSCVKMCLNFFVQVECVIFIQLFCTKNIYQKCPDLWYMYISCVFYVMYVLITFLFAYSSVHIFIEVHSY